VICSSEDCHPPKASQHNEIGLLHCFDQLKFVNSQDFREFRPLPNCPFNFDQLFGQIYDTIGNVFFQQFNDLFCFDGTKMIFSSLNRHFFISNDSAKERFINCEYCVVNLLICDCDVLQYSKRSRTIRSSENWWLWETNERKNFVDILYVLSQQKRTIRNGILICEDRGVSGLRTDKHGPFSYNTT
jgi:hypothetical protein